MTAIPFGAACPVPPGPKPTTPERETQPPARAVTPEDVETAWHAIRDLDISDAELAEACRVVIAGARDGRRDSARDILALIENPA